MKNFDKRNQIYPLKFKERCVREVSFWKLRAKFCNAESIIFGPLCVKWENHLKKFTNSAKLIERCWRERCFWRLLLIESSPTFVIFLHLWRKWGIFHSNNEPRKVEGDSCERKSDFFEASLQIFQSNVCNLFTSIWWIIEIKNNWLGEI